jgi:hypothetical protein
LRFGNTEIVFGPKVWWALLLAVVLIIVGIAVSPKNPTAGALVGVAGILGAVLGSLLQATPIPRDYTAEATSAVRGLLAVAQTIENTQILTTQLAQVKANPRVILGLVSIQDELGRLRQSVYVSMGEWDAVSPGTLDAVERLQHAGSTALARLSRETMESNNDET